MKERKGKLIPERRETDLWEIGNLRLYMPRAFKATTMMVGNSDSPIALCTGWSDPWNVVSSVTAESFSVIAPLREALGVDIMLANLLANPQIKIVVINRHGKFDDSAPSRQPIEILKAIWANGIEENGLVRGTSHQLFPELVLGGMSEKLKKMIADVQLLESEESIEEIATRVKEWEIAPSLRERVFPPEFEIPKVERFPSEEVSFQLRERNAFNGWIRLVGSIMRYGRDCSLEKGGALVRELPYTRVVLEGKSSDFFALPEWVKEIVATPITTENLEAYYLRYVRPENYLVEIYPGVRKFVRPSEEKYLYAELLFAFPRPKEIDIAVNSILESQGLAAVYQFLSSNFEIDGQKREIVEKLMVDRSIDDERKTKILLEIFVPPTNQVDDKIRRIKEMPDDADKTIILWDPRTHGMQDRGRPCWVELSFLVREGKIHTKAVFRSHDIAKGWLFNAYGIWRLWQDICQETGYEMGKMTIESESCHVYKGDETWARRLWEKRLEGVSPKSVFNPERADPRGNLVINIVDDEITCVLVSPAGQPLLKMSGLTAKGMMGEINRLGLISQTDHALDIGAELTKAEICRRLGIPYRQDKPLPWSKI